jgi:hypothetical protein
MKTPNRIRRFSRGGFFEGVGSIFGGFSPIGADPIVSARSHRSVAEIVTEEWHLIGALLWDSMAAFRAEHPEVEVARQHDQKAEAEQPAGSL